MMYDGAIINATIVTMDKHHRVIPSAGLMWKDGRIVMVGSCKEVKNAALNNAIPITYADGAFVFPGLINTHNHLFQHLLKGLGVDMNLERWWPSVIGPAGSVLREKHLRAAVLSSSLEALRTGTTTILDYFHVHPVKGLSEVELDAISEAGIRLVYARGFRDGGNSKTFSHKGLEENLDDVFLEVLELKKRFNKNNNLARIYLAPASPPAISLEGLTNVASFSKKENIPVTMHVFETGSDDEVCLVRDGITAIEYLDKAGILSPFFLAVHCVKVNKNIISQFVKHDVKISHNPLSNMYLASGVAPVPDFLKAGLTVSLATDGAASNNSNNMLEVMKTTALLHKVMTGNPQTLTAQMVLEMATIGGAKALGLSTELGSLEEGKLADLFIFEPNKSATCSPITDPVSALVYSADSRGITTTVVGGRTLLKEDHFCHLNEAEVLHQEQIQAFDLASKIGCHSK